MGEPQERQPLSRHEAVPRDASAVGHGAYDSTGGQHDHATADPRGWERYSNEEVETILQRYDIGTVERAQEYRRGSRAAPKLKVWSTEGTFLLKRRSTARHPLARIRFAHSIQASLEREGYPVAHLMRVRETGSALVLLGDHAYELFRYIEGDRYDRSSHSAARAGEALGELHRLTRAMDWSAAPPASFHDSPSVRLALDHVAEAIARIEPDCDRPWLDELSRELRMLYTRAGEEVELLGLRRLERAVVHGDWHPGNLIFRDGRVVGVIDFDSARAEPWVTEVANGMLQFALHGMTSMSPHEWPDDLDPRRLRSFLTGYLTVAARPLTMDERRMIPWMMIEAMVAESAIPVANHGRFAELKGSEFIDLVRRKCQWVRHHRRAISEL